MCSVLRPSLVLPHPSCRALLHHHKLPTANQCSNKCGAAPLRLFIMRQLLWSGIVLFAYRLTPSTAVAIELAFMPSSGKHGRNLNRSAKRQKLHATRAIARESNRVGGISMTTKMTAKSITELDAHDKSDVKAHAHEIILSIVQSIFDDGVSRIEDTDVQQTIDLLCTLEKSANDHVSPDLSQAVDENPIDDRLALAHQTHAAANSIRQLMSTYGTSGGKGRKAIKDVASILTPSNRDDVPKAFGSILIVSALAIGDHSCDDHRGISRAAASGVMPNKPIVEEMYNRFAVQAVGGLLEVALGDSSSIDLHILTSMCRSFVNDTSDLHSSCAKVVRSLFQLPDGTIDENTELPEVGKLEAAAALALSAQMGPWNHIKPTALTEIATGMNLYSAAENICRSAASSASTVDCEVAVLVLIEGASAATQYRQMDAFATEFYHQGGRLKYAEARLMHALSTIEKCVARRQYPIIEKQIERVDRAFAKAKEDLEDGEEYDESGPDEARDFAIMRLVEMGEAEAAHRLAKLWGRDFIYDDDELAKLAKKRKEKYLQWEETSVGSQTVAPDVLSDPTLFLAEFDAMMKSDPGPVGFDCEFEEAQGVALLQLSTTKKAILVDIPALSATKLGCAALVSTVGALFAGDRDLIGFACGEDVRRLRASPSALQTHWLGSSSAVVDIKPLIAHQVPELKHTGLSRAANNYLGKPLDKSEQCSMWLNRPLSLNQRAYAALDAFCCAEIYRLLPDRIKSSAK